MKKWLIFLAFQLFSHLAEAAGPPILTPVPDGDTVRFAHFRPGVTPIQVNRSELFAMPVNAPATLLLPGRIPYAVIHDRTEIHPGGNKTWIGYLAEFGKNYRIIITTGLDGSSGRILTPEGEYLIFSYFGQDQVIDLKVANLVLEIPDRDDAVTPPINLSASPDIATAMAQDHFQQAVPTPQSVVDVMVVYTQSLVSQLGSGLQARLDQMIAISNQAYIDSQVAITLRLVHSELVGYSDTTSMDAALDDITGPAVPASLSTVAAKRNTYGADLVVLLRAKNNATQGGSCGLAWINGAGAGSLNGSAEYGYAVVSNGSDGNRFCSDVTFAHELGHNMGSMHDHRTVASGSNPGGTGVFPYSFGYGLDNGFSTIMAYSSSYTNVTQVGMFSNPLINCVGLSCGISTSGAMGTWADNAQSLNAIRAEVANFRPTATSSSISGRLVNLSTRGQVQTGDNVMIGGFVIGGSTAKSVLIRAVGPNLANYGVTGVLANPMLELYSGQTQVASNDDWGSAANAAAIEASGKAPVSPLESAILVTLAPGAYTAKVSGAGGGTGVGIIEVFELDQADSPLVNLSTRGQVQTGDNVMIGGFVIQGDTPQTVLVRAVGPNLANYGVTGVLANPMLELYSGQTLVASNDDWGSAANAAAIEATGKAPVSPLESAILVTLAPGPYTAKVSGVGGVTGVGIIEVFAQ